MSLSIESKAIFSCLRSFINNATLQYSEIQDIHSIQQWEELYRLSVLHKITPAVWQSLKTIEKEIPYDIAQLFKSNTTHNAHKAMLETVELTNLIQAFTGKNIHVVPLKGSVLAQKIYGTLGHRHAGDIDLLLIDKSTLWLADKMLIQMGYHRIKPTFELSLRQKKYFEQYDNELVYIHTTLNVRLELHFDWFKNRELFPLNLTNMWNNADSIALANKSVMHPNDEDHFLYLIAHGSKHAWFRLKWLLDIPLMLNQLTETQLESINQRAKAYGMQEMLIQGLVLAKHCLNTPIPSILEYNNNTATQSFLQDYAEQALLDSKKQSSKFLSPIPKLQFLIKELRYAMALRPGFRYKRKQLALYTTVYTDWKMLKLPDWLFPAYPLLRPIFWLFRQKKT